MGLTGGLAGVEPASAVTNSSGVAVVRWELGTVPGDHALEARLPSVDTGAESETFAASAVAGTLLVLFTYYIGLRLFRRRGVAALGAFFVAIDGLALTMSRIAMLDIFLAMFVALFGGLVDPGRVAGATAPDLSDYSITGIRALFASDGGIVIGWTHYLAFDLFVGLWIARDAGAKGLGRLAQLPFLVATFLAGPIGLFLWLVVRERWARRA